MWIHRRSEEPAVTSVACYWRASSLSKVKNIEYSTLTDLCSKKQAEIVYDSSNYLQTWLNVSHEKDGNSLCYLSKTAKKVKYGDCSIYHLSLEFQRNCPDPRNFDTFLQYCRTCMYKVDLKNVERETQNQSDCGLWDEMRFGRITASRAYDVSRCKTEGSLIEYLLGASRPLQTAAVNRGRKLESGVLEAVARERNISIQKCGIFLKAQYPLFGATPDGITEEYFIEMKCPSSDSTVSNYIKDQVVQKRPMAQMQLQMFMTNKTKCLFCIASPQFELDRNVTIVEIDYDDKFCKDVMKHAEEYWKKFVYPKVVN